MYYKNISPMFSIIEKIERIYEVIISKQERPLWNLFSENQWISWSVYWRNVLEIIIKGLKKGRGEEGREQKGGWTGSIPDICTYVKITVKPINMYKWYVLIIR
jgi:hypothetical protein